jgi:hypothetical protein
MVNRLTRKDQEWLGTIGESKSILSTRELNINEVEKVLIKYASKFASIAAENLRNNKFGKDSNASGELESSIKITDVKFLGTSYTINVNMLDYWKYVNDGTRGTQNGLPNRKMPPINTIIKWIKDKQLSIDNGGISKNGYKKQGSLISKKQDLLKSVAYKIANKIKRYGTRGTLFVTNAIDDIKDDLTKDLRIAIANDLKNSIKRQ